MQNLVSFTIKAWYIDSLNTLYFFVQWYMTTRTPVIFSYTCLQLSSIPRIYIPNPLELQRDFH